MKTANERDIFGMKAYVMIWFCHISLRLSLYCVYACIINTVHHQMVLFIAVGALYHIRTTTPFSVFPLSLECFPTRVCLVWPLQAILIPFDVGCCGSYIPTQPSSVDDVIKISHTDFRSINVNDAFTFWWWPFRCCFPTRISGGMNRKSWVGFDFSLQS